MTPTDDSTRRIVPHLWFDDRAEQAAAFYTSLFDDPEARRCGWLKDRFGVSWQVCPTVLQEMMRDPDPEKVDRVTRAFMPMEKLEIATLHEAYAD
jgi:predicted 3-demethylubiquinone-9 3-methyltransferase (glyoxalase superfamily)